MHFHYRSLMVRSSRRQIAISRGDQVFQASDVDAAAGLRSARAWSS
jgi:hypothetical protein